MTSAHGADAVITSTEAARLLRRHPHDPLNWQRLDQLRSTGQLRSIGSDLEGPRFLRSDIERLARPWEHQEPLVILHTDDEGTPEKGAWKPVLVATGIGVAVWLVFGLVAWSVIR